MNIVISSRKNKYKISETEFTLTKLLLDNLYVDVESNYELSFNYVTLSYNTVPLHFAETYNSLMNMPSNKTVFRPLKNDKHANILIDMFEQLNIIKTDSLTILESVDENDVKTYKGYFTYNGKKVDKSYTYNAPTTPVLKCFMIAKLILDSYDYDIFISNLIEFNRHLNNRNKSVKENVQAN